MSAGLVALLDDVAALARLAAASIDDVGTAAGRASAKAAGVIVDDAAVTPRYVQGLEPRRELVIIRRIAKGSLRNKLLLILPALLVLSQFLPGLLTPLLMAGGAYLCFEGAEKVWEKFGPGRHEVPSQPVAAPGGEQEDTIVTGAVRTDFILSAEIMVIALNEVAAEPILSRAVILAVVAVAITAVVYGAVALIVRMDDIGVALAERRSDASRRLGRLLVKGMPKIMALLSTVGIVAMLWVGGHILLVGTEDLGWHGLYAAVHQLEELIARASPVLDGALSWLTNTVASAFLGLCAGSALVVVVHLLRHVKR